VSRLGLTATSRSVLVNAEIRKSKEYRNPKFKWNVTRLCLAISDFEIRASFVIGHSSLVIRHSDFRRPAVHARKSGRGLPQSKTLSRRATALSTSSSFSSSTSTGWFGFENEDEAVRGPNACAKR
jgi:hypothetical protein